ncbi:hypothetical protein SAMD00019534_108580 [Acytostelium subglobosum LB1]|uniref:hypothetical protein n=1 Tax=Acytostelium subglobosum LB1 TaxID=1410327 RepID=UPI000644C74F|nr:hypothetical protein SAMD00019534_108580 [Acytostelium subglobosum LB1]GAM27682.1 hypothetical protein SAMD00019534_108580 [Acytostelium subglobosum LB1]|eukprot:XP_012749341.1 hypothetical protein SAMD00019534_108580 [Acytostelium subglobosum LB1]
MHHLQLTTPPPQQTIHSNGNFFGQHLDQFTSHHHHHSHQPQHQPQLQPPQQQQYHPALFHTMNNSSNSTSSPSRYFEQSGGGGDDSYDDDRLINEQAQLLQKSLEILSDSDDSIPSMKSLYMMLQKQQQHSPHHQRNQQPNSLFIKTNHTLDHHVDHHPFGKTTNNLNSNNTRVLNGGIFPIPTSSSSSSSTLFGAIDQPMPFAQPQQQSKHMTSTIPTSTSSSTPWSTDYWKPTNTPLLSSAQQPMSSYNHMTLGNESYPLSQQQIYRSNHHQSQSQSHYQQPQPPIITRTMDYQPSLESMFHDQQHQYGLSRPEPTTTTKSNRPFNQSAAPFYPSSASSKHLIAANGSKDRASLSIPSTASESMQASWNPTDQFQSQHHTSRPAPPRQHQDQSEQRQHRRRDSHDDHYVPDQADYEVEYVNGTNKQGGSSGDQRREISESPESRQQYKQFIKEFKIREKEGLDAAMAYASHSLSSLSEKVHWRVYLELADLANRQNNLKLARKLYRVITKTKPYVSQGWLEYAKMEEDYGRLERAQQILQLGLKYSPFNESLLIKAIRHEEKMGNIDGARAMLSHLRDQSIFKTWRAVLEGGLLEARAGNVDVARKIFKYLMQHVPWYGPIYQEAYKLEERCEEYERAIAIIERGLQEDPKYGPLWFSALRLYEKTSHGFLQTTRNVVERARQGVSREVTWKIYFEAAQIEERSRNASLSRAAYVRCVEQCPENLQWKVWLGGSRTELNADNINVARKLVLRSLLEVPAKLKPLVLLEYSRLEEYAGNHNKSRRILRKAQDEARNDWKVFLEAVLLEMRAGNYEAAINEAKDALKIHSGAGRIWAAMIQLMQLKGREAQQRVFRKALQFVPKSGEVWCEGARIALGNNDLEQARQFLEFAVQFTPQFGDSFVELLRLDILENGINCDISKLEQMCINADPNYGLMWLHCTGSVLDSPRQVLRNVKKMLVEMSPASQEDYERTKDARGGCCWIGSNGVLSLDRIFRNDFNSMSNEDKRKCMFGSDQVKP